MCELAGNEKLDCVLTFEDSEDVPFLSHCAVVLGFLAHCFGHYQDFRTQLLSVCFCPAATFPVAVLHVESR